jgi:hypothetical protein
MKKKGNSITLSYESVYCKITMDYCRLPLSYGKTLVLSPGIFRDHTLLYTCLSKEGVSCSEIEYDETTDVIVFSETLLNDLKANKRPPFVERLENNINADHSPYVKLLFTSEGLLCKKIKALATHHQNFAKDAIKNKSDGDEEKWQTIAKCYKETLDTLKAYDKSKRVWEEKPDTYIPTQSEENMPTSGDMQLQLFNE